MRSRYEKNFTENGYTLKLLFFLIEIECVKYVI